MTSSHQAGSGLGSDRWSFLPRRPGDGGRWEKLVGGNTQQHQQLFNLVGAEGYVTPLPPRISRLLQTKRLGHFRLRQPGSHTQSVQPFTEGRAFSCGGATSDHVLEHKKNLREVSTN